ncbi:anhydro-N-acetylmuramic acid kinase [Oceanibacterium hippocampi]|uniref:Anhydro-N-acetylmuramic acid kinase n=1 Tax=Oceanibacterium hippocampi TaxID=745714 RepID=A0A1Y5SVM8_9PROT|nr:anhydro-N-acetylmuramic acid kinase [Oceanibacterium hippocampi]SLN49352.1 Anhydro-N-acetylmuramic acid kinase [Oceanibacterium hippocampi]
MAERESQVRVAMGLMSGTSMDGIDAAILVTDGERIVERGPTLGRPYDDDFRDSLRAVLGARGDVGDAGRLLTLRHAEVVDELRQVAAGRFPDIDVVGFHGHTVLHRPDERRTLQIGDPDLLARLTGIDVVGDFRLADVAAGGQGAPFAPLYHAALARELPHPLAVLNLGGVGNVTWIGRDGAMLAFDTGPGNALIDDWVAAHGAGRMDADGKLAAAGRIDRTIVDGYLDKPYFEAPPPKSLDRDDFDIAACRGLGLADGAATLAAVTATTVARALEHFPAPPTRWLVSGGGRKNPFILKMLREKLRVPVDPVEAVGWAGDDVEAEAFAFLAVRSLRGLPLSLPGTTGVPEPMPGGRLYRA